MYDGLASGKQINYSTNILVLFSYQRATSKQAAMTTTIPALLTKLTSSLESALEPLPDRTTILPPTDGISLLDIKSELLLSYLQNLVFLILVKIRNQIDTENADEDDSANVADEIVNKLVELRVYLEKGVRPLETKLKYQIDKVLRAADTTDRTKASDSAAATLPKRSKKVRDSTTNGAVSGSEEEFSGLDDKEEADSDEVDELSYRPNPAAFAQPKSLPSRNNKAQTNTDGIYRPPRITPTSLPTSTSTQFIDRATSHRQARPQRSSAVDEYINTELSGAPIAEPSIGTTIVAGGRRVKGAAERAREAERAAYEESNFVRLPKEAKKVEAERRRKDRGVFGGEEMRGLGEMGDRVGRVTGKRKVGRDTVDGQRGEGFSGQMRGGKRRKTGRR